MRLPTLVHSLSLIKRLVPDSCGTVVDVGVQYGTPFLIDVFGNSFHHLFEPASQFFDAIEGRYTASGINFELHRMALSNRQGEVFLHKKGMDSSGEATHFQIYDDRKPYLENLLGIDTIPTNTLDNIFQSKLAALSYIIKLDVDGAEELIMEGGHETLRNASLIIIECTTRGGNFTDRMRIVEKHGFRLWDICDNAYYFGQLSQVDLVFINERLRQQDVRLQPWESTNGKVVWEKWQAGFDDIQQDHPEDSWLTDTVSSATPANSVADSIIAPAKRVLGALKRRFAGNK